LIFLFQQTLIEFRILSPILTQPGEEDRTMAITLDGLDGEFRTRASDLLDSLKAIGIEMRPYFGPRTPAEQAVLWRQSRSKEEIAAAIARLRNGKADFLADTLDSVGPHHGPHVTNALPGLSWHQWGEALDCFWAVNGVAEWSASKIIDGINGYRVYANRAKDFGLEAGGHWTSIKDWPHVQLRKAASPVMAGMTLAEIDEAMRARFG
jgi:hypothetical protein